ncbi:MAG TPA: glycoside hydrolase family 3 N-terminal domain-containing protein [Anaerolineaceae bacterium]
MSKQTSETLAEALLLTEDGITFRDLNKNGRLDAYEDPRLPIETRIADLLRQMTLAEKAGLMFHTILPVGTDGSLVEEPSLFGPLTTTDMVVERKMNHFNIHAVPSAALAARWHNRLQKLAESTRLGIPVTISSDPRHAFTRDTAVGVMTSCFSQWCEPVGLAALRDEKLVEEFATIARQEYLAIGIRLALHPMADLATEPRWGRINGTFGEDAALSARLTAAYIRGFQGETLGRHSVACMTKHFPGGGPQKDGEDPHFHYGKEQVYPGNNFEYHLIPFEAAFRAGTAAIMPYYGQPIGLPIEEVGFSFNKEVISGMLRGRFGFDGVVCTDWRLLTDATRDGKVFVEAKCWGVEHLTVEQRALKAIDAGVDQFGGEACPEVLVALVESGLLPEARLDESVRRLLRLKFQLGLFDNPYVDEEAAEKIAGRADFRARGEAVQRQALVLLKNGETAGGGKALPLKDRPRLYIEGIDPAIAAEYGEVVAEPSQAEFAILRLAAPFEPRQGFLESRIHGGRLDYDEEQRTRILGILRTVPTIVDIYLDRPAVVPEIAAACAGLIGNFGASDRALLDVLFGRSRPAGKLPFEMPSSMAAVAAQKPDVPYDSAQPLFPYGFGLEYQE